MTATCSSVRNALIGYVAACLEPLEAARIGDHLQVCDGCRTRVSELLSVVDAIAGAELPPFPVGRREAIRACIRAAASRAETVRYGALQAAGFAAALAATAGSVWVAWQVGWVEAIAKPWVAAVATGAIAVLCAGLVPVLKYARREGDG